MNDLETFTTARLRAERLQPSHHDDILAMHRDPRQMAMLGGVRDVAQTVNYLDRNLLHWDQHGFGVWVLRDAESGVICGRTLLRTLSMQGADEVEVGYSFLPEYWGRGLATEVTLECLRIGFDRLQLASIIAITVPHNAASRRVMEKSGMTYDRDITHGGVAALIYRVRQPA